MSHSTSRTQRNDKIDYLPHLDYPHDHDPTMISDVAGLSADLLRQLPTDLQDALWLVQEAASVVYASHERLMDLVDAKFNRLILLRGKQDCKLITQCSNSCLTGRLTDRATDNPAAFENYTNQLTAERRYLLEDAYPDWKHKLSTVQLAPYLDLSFNCKGKKMLVRDWFTSLQDAVTIWAQEARGADIPDFEETVSEHTSRDTTPTGVSSSESLGREWEDSGIVVKAGTEGMAQGDGAGRAVNGGEKQSVQKAGYCLL
jgi:hypothetical protein